MSLFENIAATKTLLEGFFRVHENDGAAGSDAVSVEAFEANLEFEIQTLSRELHSGTYHPLPLLSFERKKENGDTRKITIPAVRDRVAQAAARLVLDPVFEKEFEPVSYGYRKGFSRQSAALRINSLYKEGYEWILDADISSFFDTVNHGILFKRIEQLIPEQKVTRLLQSWITGEILFGGKKSRITTGLPLGMPISPMLANLYLDKFDEKLVSLGYKLIRYADDFLILTKSKPEAIEALRITKNLLDELALQLNTAKTKITKFEDGFEYLGYIFLKSVIVPASTGDTTKFPVKFEFRDPEEKALVDKIAQAKPKTPRAENKETARQSEPPISIVGEALKKALLEKGISIEQLVATIEAEKATAQPVEHDVFYPLVTESEITIQENGAEGALHEEKPELSTEKENILAFKHTLYVQEQGVLLRKEGNRFIVLKEEKELLDVPTSKIQQIIIFGNCVLTNAAMQHCLQENIPVTFLSSRGKYFGRLESTSTDNAYMERLQVLRSFDKDFSLQFGIKTLQAKVMNCRSLLQRVGTRRTKLEDVTPAIDFLKKTAIKMESPGNIESLRGLEGSAAAAYFRAYGKLFDEKSGFYTNNFCRIMHPPVDPVNSLLSFGYTMLSSYIYSFLRGINLNPYAGFVHTDRSGHPALVSDLLEEFRALIDALALQVINRKILKTTDFYFEKEPGTPCFLTNEGRKEYIRQFEIMLRRETLHPATRLKVDLKRMLDLQVKHFLAFIKGDSKTYTPYRLEY